MSKQLLIYENATPITVERHAQWSVEVGSDFRFAQHLNSVPLTAVEFSAAAAEYPIVFTQGEETIAPAVILGLKGQQNFFLSADQQSWEAKYIPAFIRRYPFVFSLSEDQKTFTLCLDESFPGFNQKDRGQKLFGADGKPSPYVANLLPFLQEFEAQFARTRTFCRNLDELELLEPMHAEMVSATGEKSAISGFMCVNREKLKSLSGKTLARLAASDELELLYTHLYSLRNFENLKDRLSQQKPAQTEPVVAKASKAAK